MSKDLTSSKIDRQNILNNELAIAEIQKQTRIKGIFLKIDYVSLKVWLPPTLK